MIEYQADELTVAQRLGFLELVAFGRPTTDQIGTQFLELLVGDAERIHEFGRIADLIAQTEQRDGFPVQVAGVQLAEKFRQRIGQFAVAQGRGADDQGLVIRQRLRGDLGDVEQRDFVFGKLLFDLLGDLAGVAGIGGVEQTNLGHEGYLVAG